MPEMFRGEKGRGAGRLSLGLYLKPKGLDGKEEDKIILEGTGPINHQLIIGVTRSLLPQDEKEGRIIIQKVEEKKKRKKIRMDAHPECQGTANDFTFIKMTPWCPKAPKMQQNVL